MQPKDRRLVTEQNLENGLAPLDGRLEAVEAMAGLSPGAVTDAQTANVINQSGTQSRFALNRIVDERVSPVERTSSTAERIANTANALAISTSGRVDAIEVLSEMRPGNVDDATISLHVNQENSLARDAVARVLLDKSTNLFDATKFTDGFTLSASDGQPVVSASNGVSPFIRITPGAQYTGECVARWAWYDAQQELVSTAATLTSEVNTFFAPPEAQFLRVVVRMDEYDSVMVNLGETLLPYESGGAAHIREEYLPPIEREPVTPKDTTFFRISTNLFDSNTVTEGFTYSLDGVLTERSEYVVSDWIPVEQLEPYTYNGGLNRVSYFGQDQTYVSGFESTGVWPRTEPVPLGVRWVRISVHKDNVPVAQMNTGSTHLDYEPGGDTIDPHYLPEDQGRPHYVLDSHGLGEIYTAPTIDAQPDLDATTTADVYAWYDALVDEHPDYVTRTDLGPASGDTYNLYAYTLKAPKVPTATDLTSPLPLDIPAIILMAGVHGYEKAAVYHLWRFAKALCEEWQDSPVLDAIRWNLEVVIIPVGVPYAYDTSGRNNANGVDIARNFAADWSANEREPGAYPLSEPEASAIDELMHTMAPRTVFGSSFHNFSGTAERQVLIWQAAASEETLNLGTRLISRMSRKWAQDHDWITQYRTYYGYSDRGAPRGSEGRAMESHGFLGATFETSRMQFLDGGNGETHGSRAMTLGYEATVNYIAIGSKLGIDLKNRA